MIHPPAALTRSPGYAVVLGHFREDCAAIAMCTSLSHRLSVFHSTGCASSPREIAGDLWYLANDSGKFHISTRGSQT